MHRFFLNCLFAMALCACEVSPAQTQITQVPTNTPTQAILAHDTATVLPSPTVTHTLVSITAMITPVPTNTETSQAAIANYLAAQKNPILTNEEKIKIAIDTYFTLRYEGQKAVAAQDFSPLVEDSTLDWVKKEIDKREIELYIACMFDLDYQSYKFNLDYSSIVIKDDQAEISLMESHKVVFKAVAPQASEMSGLSHQITLHKKNGVWVIYEDQYRDENTQLIASSTKENIKKQVDANYAANGGNNLDNSETEKCQTIIH
jgi:hypothetical protein